MSNGHRQQNFTVSGELQKQDETKKLSILSPIESLLFSLAFLPSTCSNPKPKE